MNPNPEKSQNAQNEEKILQFWRDNTIFQKTLEKDSPAGDYNFFEGPPTANGRPGIHHVAARSFKDIIPRYKTMRGFRVQRKAGWDTHGLPVELQVEKQLGLKSKKEIEAYGLAEFNKKCKESVWTYKDEWEQLTERMGYWLDMKNPYITYDNSYIEALWGIVKRADERGHLYRDFRVGPWCTRCGTTLSSHELNQPGAYKDVKDLSIYAKFKIVGTDNGYFVAWTTTPWTLPGNVALAVGADIDYVEAKIGNEILVVAKDRVGVLGGGYEIIAEHKGSEMVGMKYEPLYPYLSELISNDQKEKMEKAYQVYAADFVNTTDGTGIVHTAVMYGADDFDLGTRVGLPKFHTVNEEGKFIAGTGFLEGRYVKETDENGKPTLAVDIVNDLTERGLLFKKENYIHSYPHCWRCDTPLVYYARTSWYFRMSALRDQLLDANKTINWEPDHIRDGRFGEWLDGIKDWAISRDRYWGTPLPVWQTESGKRVVIGGIDDIKKYSKKSGNKYFVVRHGQAHSNVTGETKMGVWDSMGDTENRLTDTGKSQVLETAQKVKQESIDVIIASPLLRAQETAQIIAEQIGYDPAAIVTDRRVVEWQVGSEFQGKSIESFMELRNTSNDRYQFKTIDGESYAEVIKRCGDFLYDIEQQYQEKNILIVCHNSSARGLFLSANGFTFENLLKQEAQEYPFTNGELRKLDFVPLPHNERYELDFHKPYIDEIELELDGEKLIRTPEVMDVWFDSGSVPIAQAHKLGEEINFDPSPADYISEGVDQTRGWFYTMHAIANMLHDQPTQAYKNVICLGLVLDANGQKMSKSRGNVVDPWAMFDKYGADVVRFWFYSVNQPGEFKNFDEKSLADVQNKFFRVVDNLLSMLDMYGGAVVDHPRPMDILDKWIWSYLAETTRVVTDALENYDILKASRKLKEFIIDLSQWYIRLSRDNIRDKEVSRNFVAGILQQFALISAPFIPFTSEKIWMRLYGNAHNEVGSVHLWHWPKQNSFSDITFEEQNEILSKMEIVRNIASLGLEARQRANIKVRQPLSSITISESLSPEYLEILKDELNVKSVVVDENLAQGTVELDTTITDDLRDEGDMRELVRRIQDMRKDADLVPGDRVTVYLMDSEPQWFGKYQSEILKTVGADEIKWGSEIDMIDKV